MLAHWLLPLLPRSRDLNRGPVSHHYGALSNLVIPILIPCIKISQQPRAACHTKTHLHYFYHYISKWKRQMVGVRSGSMRKTLVGNDVGGRFLPTFILEEKKTLCAGRGCAARTEQAAMGEPDKSWMLIQRLSRDYSRFAKIQQADLSHWLSVLVTMPTAMGNY